MTRAQSSGHQIKWGAMISYSTIAFNIAAGLLYTPWMISCIGNSQYSLYVIATSIISIFLMDFGLSAAVSKFLSQFYARGENEKANRFVSLAFRFYLYISAIILAVLVIVYQFLGRIYANLDSSELQILRIIFLIVASYSILSFPFTPLSSIIGSKEKFIALNLCSLGQKVATTVLIIIALLMHRNVYALVSITAICGLLTVVVKIILVRRFNQIRLRLSGQGKEFAGEMISFSVWITISQLTQRSVINIAPSIIGIHLPANAVTCFSLAITLERYVYNFATAVNGLFLPRVSRIVNQNGAGLAITDLMCKVGRLEIYMLGLVMIGFACVGRQFITLWMGDGYESIYLCALLLMLQLLLNAPQQIGYTTVLARNMIKTEAIIDTVSAVIGILMLITFTRLLGIWGGGLAVCFTYIMKGAAMNVVFQKKLDIDSFRYFKEGFRQWLIPAAVTLAAGLMLNRLLPGGGWICLGGKIVCITAVYCVLTYLLSFNGFEKQLMWSIVNKSGLGRSRYE